MKRKKPVKKKPPISVSNSNANLSSYNSEFIFLLADFGCRKKSEPLVKLHLVIYYVFSIFAVLKTNGVRYALFAFEFKKINDTYSYTLHLLFFRKSLKIQKGEWFIL